MSTDFSLYEEVIFHFEIGNITNAVTCLDKIIKEEDFWSKMREELLFYFDESDKAFHKFTKIMTAYNNRRRND